MLLLWDGVPVGGYTHGVYERFFARKNIARNPPKKDNTVWRWFETEVWLRAKISPFCCGETAVKSVPDQFRNYVRTRYLYSRKFKKLNLFL